MIYAKALPENKLKMSSDGERSETATNDEKPAIEQPASAVSSFINIFQHRYAVNVKILLQPISTAIQVTTK